MHFLTQCWHRALFYAASISITTFIFHKARNEEDCTSNVVFLCYSREYLLRNVVFHSTGTLHFIPCRSLMRGEQSTACDAKKPLNVRGEGSRGGVRAGGAMIKQPVLEELFFSLT